MNAELITNWVKENQISILNIGGPRESTCPGIYQSSFALLEITLAECKHAHSLRAKI